MRKIKLVIEKTKDGYWGSLNDTDAAFAFGKTIDELVVNTREGIGSYYEEMGLEKPEVQFDLVASDKE